MQISPDPAPGIGTGAERARPERDEEVRGILDGLRALARELRVEPQGRSQGARIGPAQLRVLRLLADQPAASVSDLAQRAQADVSSASVVVSRLVESGLVRRATDADDRRRVPLGLTARGRATVRRSADPDDARIRRAAASLTDREVRRLARGC
jgi:DNA-binding MarR family transcriptional regulator